MACLLDRSLQLIIGYAYLRRILHRLHSIMWQHVSLLIPIALRPRRHALGKAWGREGIYGTGERVERLRGMREQL